MTSARVTGNVKVTSSPRSRNKLLSRLTEMAQKSDGLHLAFSSNVRTGSSREGGAQAASALLEWVAINDDANRLPNDIDRKIRDAMGDVLVGVHVHIDGKFS